MASGWFLFFIYHNDARSNKHQIRMENSFHTYAKKSVTIASLDYNLTKDLSTH